MTDTFSAVRHGGVLEVALAPPFDLGPGARGDLARLLAAPGDGITGILVCAGPSGFSGGPDVPRAGDGRAPDLAALCVAVEDCAVPVTFVVEGNVAGAIAEVALAAHVRVAPPGARMAVGSLALGLISGAGGTQRLAALIGAEQTLRLMRSGMAVGAPEALALGLIDDVIEADTRDAMLSRARAGAGLRPDRPGLRDMRGHLAAVAEARGAARSLSAKALVDCVEAAALLPRDQALGFEASVAVDLAATDEAAALCHIHLAERQQAVVAAAPVAHLALLGAATPLVGIVLAALVRGVQVTLVEGEREALVGFLKTVAARQEASVQAGQMTEAQRDAAWARLVAVGDAEALEACDLTIAVEGAEPLAGDTHGPLLMVSRGALPPRGWRLTLSGRVAEVGLPAADAAGADLALGFLRRLGLIVVATNGREPVGIAGRLAMASGAAMRAMMALGVPHEAVVQAMARFGLSVPAAAETPVPPYDMAGDEVVRRVMAAMANEGARLVAAGVARKAPDIDLVAVHALGFTRECGGPMHQAQRRGLLLVRRDLGLWAGQAEVWRPVPALDACVSAGGFEGMS